jgi:hypothetical protein
MVTIKGEPGDTFRYEVLGMSSAENILYTQPFSVSDWTIVKVRAFRENKLPSAPAFMHFTFAHWKEPSEHGKLASGLHYYAREIPAGGSFSSGMLYSGQESRFRIADSGTAATISSKYLSRKENAGLSFGGYFYAASDDLYTFYLSSDDGSRMFMKEQTIIDNDGNHGPEERSVQLPLKKGYHYFVITYFNGTGDGQLSLQYSTDKISKRPVPDNFFFQPVK